METEDTMVDDKMLTGKNYVVSCLFMNLLRA